MPGLSRPKIGFMQGRLSPKPVDRIQAFPKDNWRSEFDSAAKLGFDCIELIYDELYLEQNPLNSPDGRAELVRIAQSTGVSLHSICADYFMVRLLTTSDEKERMANVERAIQLLGIAVEINCPMVEFPFVDSSSVVRQAERDLAADSMSRLCEVASRLCVKIGLETDLSPVLFRKFLDLFPKNTLGANLDLGNSAALGFDVRSECRAFGDRIVNVHVKDRQLGGTTVSLGEGNTDFPRAFSALSEAGYSGAFILQTAPSPDYLGAASRYRDMVKSWTSQFQAK